MAKKVKIPKRVAGVKVPRKLRRKAKEALALAENPAVRELAAAALGAAAVKLADIARAAALEGARRLLDETGQPEKEKLSDRPARP